MMLLRIWIGKAKKSIIAEDLQLIKDEHPEYPWINVDKVDTKWEKLKSSWITAKRVQIKAPGGGVPPPIKNDDMYLNIILLTHALLNPLKLVESSNGVVKTTTNEVAQAMENAPKKPANKRKQEEAATMNKKMNLLLDKELSSEFKQDSIKSDLAKAMQQANRLKAMELTKGLIKDDIRLMKEDADFLLE